MSPYDPVDAKLRAEAMTWFVRMRNPGDDPEDPFPTHEARQAAFVAWMRAAPRHVWAYFEAAHYFADLRAYAPRVRRTEHTHVAPMTHNQPDSRLRAWFSLGRGVLNLGLSMRLAAPHRKLWAAVLGVLCAVRVAIPTSILSDAPACHFDSYATAVGQSKTLRVSDGSSIQLNTDTSLEVCICANQRIVNLVYGQAYFQVEHDSIRPFVVYSGSNLIKDVGTEFDVFHRSLTTSVTVIKGRVQISKISQYSPGTDTASVASPKRVPNENTDASFEVGAGHQVDLFNDLTRATSSAATLDEQQVNHLLGWRHGALFVNGLSLAQATEELARYNRVRFVFGDPALSRLKPGGTVPVTDVHAFLQELHLEFGIEPASDIVESGIRVITLTRTQGATSARRKN